MERSKEKLFEFMGDNKIRSIILLVGLIILCGSVFMIENRNKFNKNPYDIDSISEIDEYLNKIDKNQSSQNIDISLYKAACDNNVLLFVFKVRNNTEEIQSVNEADVNISSLRLNNEEVPLNCKNYFERKDDNEVIVIKKIEVSYNTLPKDINVKLQVNSMFKKSGKWDMNFNINTEKISKNTYSENLNRTINLKYNNDIKIENVIISPISTKITYTMSDTLNEKLKFLVLNKDEEMKYFSKRVSESLENSVVYINENPIENIRIMPVIKSNDIKELPLECNKININEFHQFYLKVNEKTFIKIEDCIRDGNNLIIKYNYEYNGYDVKTKLADLYVIADGVKKDENTDDTSIKLKKEYMDNKYQIAFFDIGDVDGVEIGCYDGSSTQVLSEEIFNIENN